MLFVAVSVFWIFLMSSKICNNISNKGLSHYFWRKPADFRQRKNLKVKQKKLLLNDYVIKNNVDVIFFITWLMLKFLLKSKDVLYQVSSDLGELNAFIAVFLMQAKKPPAFESSKKLAWYRVKSFDNSWGNPYKKSLIY